MSAQSTGSARSYHGYMAVEVSVGSQVGAQLEGLPLSVCMSARDIFGDLGGSLDLA